MLNQDTIGEVVSESRRSEHAVAQAEDPNRRPPGARRRRPLTSLWVELTHAQLTHNFETLRLLLDCRDWHTLGKVQQAFIDASVARLNQTVSRHLELAGAMMTNLLAPQ